MGEDKKKLNTDAENQKAFDEITDGFYDLSAVYSGAPEKQTQRRKLTREEALKLRDEKRRAFEMQAIKEDIERRYSIQLEQAQSNIQADLQENKNTIIEFEVDSSVVDEEIQRMNELIDSEAIAESEEETKEKTVSETESFDIAQCNSVYAFVYLLGNSVVRIFAFLFSLVSGAFRILSKILRRLFGGATVKTRRKFRDGVRKTLREVVCFRREIKSASRSIKKALRKPLSLPSVFAHYIRKAISRHKKLLKSTANIAMPVLSVIILIITVNYWSGVTFALEVIYNDCSIGYISNEAVYAEAKDIVKNRLSTGGISTEVEATVASAANLRAEYKIAVVSVEELNDAQAISDKMIENSVDNLTHACGVYVDGKFICAVKNEADAKSVFYSLLEPYEEEAEKDGYVVGFAQNIDYVQGLYRDDESIMWDAPKLAEKLSQPKEDAVIHQVSDGDTLASIAEEYGIEEDYLKALNPDYDFENAQQGDKITVKQSSEFINIKKTVTTSEIRDVEFDTIKKKDNTKYSSYKRVEQKGVNGSERVIRTKIYIDGELTETKYDYETIVEPVDEIVVVGTKTYYDGVYVGSPSESGFLWPAPSCHYVSSPYGWRSSGWHNGIDLVKSGGGANGTPVIASRSGTVEVVRRSNSGYGNMVIINHGDGYKTRYAHMISGSITVKVGDYVEAGRTIGRVGSTGNSTGPHLHFEVIYRGETQNPRNYIYG
ncbi:MAG: M23 family metallopeptidase [Clostridia bacterium]|nr:M23 family metallopeptidase [Clostridia bacterium]